MESDDGMNSAAPIPWITRAAISDRASGASPQAADAAVKSRSPAAKSRFAPRRSASPPERSSRLAKLSVYPSMTQESPRRSVFRLAWMLGTATLPAVTSSSAMPRPKLVATSVHLGAASLVMLAWMHGPDVRMHGFVRAVHAHMHGMPGWDDVRFFLEVSRGRTFAAAAKKLGVDYTTVGRRVAALERELGAKLFERTPDGFVSTEAGEDLRAAAERMEAAALELERRALGA